MNKLKGRIPLKYLYVLSACIAILLSVGLYYTYAMFTANVSSGNVVNMDTTLNYTFDVSGTQNFHVGKNSIASFNFIVNNSSEGTIHYEIYYDTSNDLTNVIIGEVVEDKNTTTTALNTSGNIDKDNRKTIPLVIANNSNNDIDITIGVVTGYVGNTITYGTNNYPNGTKITNTYNSSDITNSCEAGTSVGDNCIIKIENGKKVTYCPTLTEDLEEDPSGANRPVLAEGMIPITYDGSKWVKADVYGNYSNWYDYNNKKWANAVMVSSSTRNTYMNADTGTEVKEADILAYYVWIPRYKYQLFNATYASRTSSQLIDVVFENGTSTTGTVTCTYASNGAETCTNKSNGNWYTHPAFTMINASGNKTELKGIWVGKFEVSGSTTAPRVKPGVKSLRNINVSSMYSTGQLFRSTDYLTTNGVSTADSHMMKNIEWGAAAYLKQSIYGLGITDIIINNNGSYYTGGGSGTGYKTNTGQSTTGNITGVYDMSGGAYEHVMGNYNKRAGDSGLTVSGIPAEHIDIYSGTSVSASHLGDATGETAGWYSDYAVFVNSSNPWFIRGGNYYFGDDEGVFSFDADTGGGSSSDGFRVALSTTGA
ncbi:MAG: hypothetical protein ACI312_02565 [Bacilli bacterium]